MEREESQKEAFLSFHSSLEISPPTRDSHISTAPATRPVFVEQRKTARRIYLGGWESGNPEAGFPLSHRPDQPAAQGKNHFEKQLKTKAVYTKLLTPPATLIYRLLRWGQPYVDEGAEAYEKRYKEVRVKSLTAAAKDLGYQLTPAATQL